MWRFSQIWNFSHDDVTGGGGDICFLIFHTTTLKFHKRIPAAAKQWKAMVAKHVNTKTQHKHVSVLLVWSHPSVWKMLDLELLHQHRGFRRNVHPCLEAGVRSHVTASKDVQLSWERKKSNSWLFHASRTCCTKESSNKAAPGLAENIVFNCVFNFLLSLLNAQLELFFSEKPWSGFIEDVTRASTDSAE